MNLQVLGVLLLTAGIWTVYGGVVGFNPLTTMQQILANPGKASQVIADNKSSLSVGVVAEAVRTKNPFASFTITGKFGDSRPGGRSHEGVDFAMPVGTPIPSPVSGILSNNPSGGLGGYVATVTTPEGYKHQFMHLSRFVDKNGQKVSAGQIIGYSGGQPGSVGAGDATGPHLHYDIITPQGKYIDPLTYLTRNRSGGVSF